ncbi:hypothetical protein OAS39_12200 [Pirellulales bacterium]|nr:hypothetical protein [Pirellulales bacterium]
MGNESNVGPPVQVGELAYQIYRRTWQGRAIFGCQIGKPFVSRTTGAPMLLRSYDEKHLDDVASAARAAKKQIRGMKQAVADQCVPQQTAEHETPGLLGWNSQVTSQPEIRCDEPRTVPLAKITPKKVMVQDGKLVPYEAGGDKK